MYNFFLHHHSTYHVISKCIAQAIEGLVISTWHHLKPNTKAILLVLEAIPVNVFHVLIKINEVQQSFLIGGEKAQSSQQFEFLLRYRCVSLK